MSVIDGVTVLTPAPDGYVVDFDNPQRQANIATYWICGIGVFFALLFTAQRLYVKLVIGHGLQIDDAFLGLAWITSAMTQVMVIYMFAKGLGGVHAWEISLDKFNQYMLVVWIASWIYILCGSFAKIAMLIFYRRLTPQRYFHICIYVAMGIIFVYTTGIFFGFIFSCNPVSKSYNILMEGTCIDQTPLYIATAIANIGSDVILLALPMPMVFQLNMQLRKKLALLFIFGLGSLTLVSSVIRAILLPELLGTTDVTWVVSYSSLMIVVEANLIIVCATLPTLRKFVRNVAPKLISDSTYLANAASGGHVEDEERSGIITYGALPVRKAPRAAKRYSQYARGGDSYTLETLVENNGRTSPILTLPPLKYMGCGRGGSLRIRDDVKESDRTVRIGTSDSWDGMTGHSHDSERPMVSDPKFAAGIVQTTTVSVSYGGIEDRDRDDEKMQLEEQQREQQQQQRIGRSGSASRMYDAGFREVKRTARSISASRRKRG